jgi:hypothetical protein
VYFRWLDLRSGRETVREVLFTEFPQKLKGRQDWALNKPDAGIDGDAETSGLGSEISEFRGGGGFKGCVHVGNNETSILTDL